MSALLNLLVTIILFGVAMWLINNFIPMPGAIKMVLNIVVLVVVILYALQFFGLMSVELPQINFFK